MKKIRIAVVGSGISGLSAAWLLSRRHDVTLFEADPRLGGHTNTVNVSVAGGTTAIDTGFIVSNTWTYPNFSAFMDHLGVAMTNTAMSFSVSAENGRYEYAGENLATLLGTPRQWASPRHWRMIADLVRFYRTAERLAPQMPESMTLGQFLHRENYGETFMRRHILPMAGAIWSSTPEQVAAYPLRAFVRFFANHKLFALGHRPDWRTVTGGSRQYVKRLVADGRFAVRVSSPVAALRRGVSEAHLTLAGGETESFDAVVLATHADQALGLLSDPSPAERALLRPFKTSPNRVLLHRDTSLMPRTRRLWSAWNYRGDEGGQDSRLAVTYWMNALQKLETSTQHFVSLNPQQDPAAHLIDGTFQYRHPLFNVETLAAQRELWSLQGVNRTWFCGAWFGSGFHEDGLQAGLAVAEQLGGVARPWTVAEPSGRIYAAPLAESQPYPFREAAE